MKPNITLVLTDYNLRPNIQPARAPIAVTNKQQENTLVYSICRRDETFSFAVRHRLRLQRQDDALGCPRCACGWT